MIQPVVLSELDHADDLVSVGDVAQMLRIHPNGLKRAVECHTVASTVRDGVRLVSYADVMAWLREPNNGQ